MGLVECSARGFLKTVAHCLSALFRLSDLHPERRIECTRGHGVRAHRLSLLTVEAGHCRSRHADVYCDRHGFCGGYAALRRTSGAAVEYCEVRCASCALSRSLAASTLIMTCRVDPDAQERSDVYPCGAVPIGKHTDRTLVDAPLVALREPVLVSYSDSLTTIRGGGGDKVPHQNQISWHLFTRSELSQPARELKPAVCGSSCWRSARYSRPRKV